MKKVFILFIVFISILNSICFADTTNVVENNFDKLNDIEFIENQILNAGSITQLEEENDNYFARINSYDNDLTFNLIQFEEFSSAENSILELKIKPMIGAQWFEIYLNSNLVNRYEMGNDLKIGEWNELEVDITSYPIIESISIKLNKNAEFYIDYTKIKPTSMFGIDLDTFSGNNIQLTENSLEAYKYNDNNYAVLDNVIISKGEHVIHTKESDWNVSTDNRAIKYDSEENMIIGGVAEFTPIGCDEDVFDDSISTPWTSTKKGDNVNGVEYIGCEFLEPQNVTHITILHDKYARSTISSGIVQYYNEETAEWVDVQTNSIDSAGGYSSFPVISNVLAKQWRLLAASGTGSSSYAWKVFEADFFVRGEYVSTNISFSDDKLISKIGIDYQSKDELKVQIRYSDNNGLNWSSWQEIKNGEEINLNTNVLSQNLLVQYKVNNGNIHESKLEELKITAIPHQNEINNILKDKCIEKIEINSEYQFQTISREITEVTSSSSATKILSDDGKKLYVYDPTYSKIYEINLENNNHELLGVDWLEISNNGEFLCTTILSELYLYHYPSKTIRKMDRTGLTSMPNCAISNTRNLCVCSGIIWT